LKDDYQLILIDALGHGKSDKHHEQKYYEGDYPAKNIIGVMDDFNINTTRYFGYSMGGNIGLRLAFSYPERMKSMIIGGVDPLAGTAYSW
jgi:pimeloyl-ACP methyl ester carboxylesterase